MKAPREDFDRRFAGPGDVVAVYQIVLGRNPESDSAVDTHRGKSLPTVIADILGSAEMAQLIANTMSSGVAPQKTNLGGTDFGQACRWLSAEIDDDALEDAASWWLLVDKFLNGLWRGRSGREVAQSLADYAALAASRADDDRAAFARVRSSTAFDPEWFRRAHAQAINKSGMAKDVTPAHYFMTIGRHQGDLLLAAFSEAMPTVYSAVPADQASSLDAFVEAVVAAGGRGETGHWLFAAEFCREMRGRRAGLSGGGVVTSVSYPQFLAEGDRDGWAPHPLFCHFSYQKLNNLPDSHATFEHYITRGIFEGLRTSSLFDPEHYLESHPSARMAVLQGRYHDALHHFIKVGIYQDFRFSPDFDPAYYCEIYPDVIESIRTGVAASASWHFLHHGLIERRRPNSFFDPHYYVQRHPHIVEEMAMLGVASELEHFLLVGRGRGLKSEPPLSERRPSLDEAKIVFHRRAMRSLDRQWRAPYDFLPFRQASPIVSVIVPVSDEMTFTALFLESAFFAAAEIFHAERGGIEVIVVDNGSKDHTAAFVKMTKGVGYIHFPEKIGYPSAIRAGMDVATGRIIVVANNDVAFLPDAFDLIATALDADDTIGVLGPLVMLPNETLQDAGCFVDRNGGIVNLGRFENPWDAHFRAPIEVDYCAGCFFAVRRADYEAIGGIDESYSPGYYEEVDFVFRMREKLGKRAIVLPDLQVTHFEHGSFGKGRPPSTAFATILRNKSLFSGRHRQALLSRPTPSELAPGGRASVMATGRRRLLVIVDAMPHFTGGCRAARSALLLRDLGAAGWAFELLVLDSDPDVDEYEDPRVVVRRGWMPGEAPEIVLAEVGRKYSHVLLIGLAQLGRFAPMLEPIRQATGVAILCDIEALEAPALLAGRGPVEDSRDAVRLELSTATLVSVWIAADQQERRLIEDAGLGSALAFTMPIAATETPRPGWEERAGAMLLSEAADSPASLAWFVGHVEPLLSSDARATPISIAGGWRTRLALSPGGEGPQVTANVIDTRDLSGLEAAHDDCCVAIAAPSFRSAASVLRSMALGVPVVMTRSLAERVTGDGGIPTGLAVVPDGGRPSSFVNWVDRLIGDPDAWAEVRGAQFALLERRCGSDSFAADLDRLIGSP